MVSTQLLLNQLLGVAALAAGLGHLVVCWQRGRTGPGRRWLAGLVLSAAAGASAAYLALSLTALPLTPIGAGLLGFAVGAVWGPSGLWRLASWLGPGARKPYQSRRIRRVIARTGRANRLNPTKPVNLNTEAASNPTGKVLD